VKSGWGRSFFFARGCKGLRFDYSLLTIMKKFFIILTAGAVAYFGLAASADAGRRSRSDVPPPVTIDRTVFTPVVSGL
jgi:hypothetical protein